MFLQSGSDDDGGDGDDNAEDDSDDDDVVDGVDVDHHRGDDGSGDTE